MEKANNDIRFSRRALIVIGFTMTAVLTVLIAWQALHVLLLIYAGVLIGIFLDTFKSLVSRYMRLPSSLALVFVLVVLFVILGYLVTLLAPMVKSQAATLIEKIPELIRQLRDFLRQFEWGDQLFGKGQPFENLLLGQEGEKIMSTAKNVVGVFSSTFGALTGIVFILIIGVYFAAEMTTYSGGLVKLIPPGYRKRGGEILSRLATMLRWWLLGQSFSMLLLGLLVFSGLWVMNIPYALVLALFTAIMTFIPNLGPIISYIPTALVALTKDPYMLVYVTVFYILVQSIEGFFITPMVHRKIITVPPVLIISVQVLLFNLIGFLGVVLAMPLVACALVLIQMIYVEDILGDRQQSE